MPLNTPPACAALWQQLGGGSNPHTVNHWQNVGFVGLTNGGKLKRSRGYRRHHQSQMDAALLGH